MQFPTKQPANRQHTQGPNLLFEPCLSIAKNYNQSLLYHYVAKVSKNEEEGIKHWALGIRFFEEIG